MKYDIYIVRHAQAIKKNSLLPGSLDDLRWLTEKGRRRFHDIAQRFQQREGSRAVELILTSPLPRAVMTAEILSSALGARCPVEVCQELRPWEPVEGVLELIWSRAHRPLALVGHEPQLSELLGQLLKQPQPELPKGGIAKLRLDELNSNADARQRYLLSSGE